MTGPLGEAVVRLKAAGAEADKTVGTILLAQANLNEIHAKIRSVYGGLDMPLDLWQAIQHLIGVLGQAGDGFVGLADKLYKTAQRIERPGG